MLWSIKYLAEKCCNISPLYKSFHLVFEAFHDLTPHVIFLIKDNFLCFTNENRLNNTKSHSYKFNQAMCTCWSSGVQMPQVIWLSRLISEDQCLCPLTEPTNTKPSRYAMRAWVPSCDHVKSLTWREEIFPFKIFVYVYRTLSSKYHKSESFLR